MPLTQAQVQAATGIGTPPPAPPSSATPSPRPQTLPSHAGAPVQTFAQSLLAPFIPVATGAARVAGTGVSKAFDILNRPSAANQARLLRGPGAGLQTFVHSESPEQYQADTAELTRRATELRAIPPIPPVGSPFTLKGSTGYGPVKSPAMTKAEYDAQPGWWHFVSETAEAIKNDPTTYLGGAGILEHLGEAVASRSVVGMSRVIEEMLQHANPEVRQAGKGLAWAYDKTHFKGAAQRALAAKHGEEGLHYFRGLKAINNARRTEASGLGHELMQQYDEVTKGLGPVEEGQLYEAIHTGKVAELAKTNPALAERAAAFKNVTDSLAHLQGTEAVQKLLAKGGAVVSGGKVKDIPGGFELSSRFKPFESETPRGLQGSQAYREHYIPTRPGRMDKIDKDSILGRDEPATADSRSLSEILTSPREEAERRTPGLESEDKALLERGEGAQLLGPALQRKVIEARLKGGAQAIAAHDAEGRVAKLFGKDTWDKVPNDAKAFFQETWHEPGGAEFWGGLFKKGIDIPKAALFALPFRHMANIASLSFLADPSLAQTFGTAGRFMRLMLARDPELRAKIMGKAGQYGIGASSFDRKPGWVGSIPLVGSLYKASNHTLWTFDDAAKATRFDRLLKRFQSEGMDEAHAAYKAADRVGGEMVDYSNNSPLTETLRYIFPFASWRTKFPFAVAGSVARHPEVATNIGRVSPEMVGDVQQAPGTTQYGEQKGGKSNLPLAEAFRGVENPWEFGRAALGYPAQMAASALGIHSDDYKNYMTYGKDPDLKFLLNATLGQFPGASAALNKAGAGEFQSQGDLSGSVGQQLGLGATHGPSPEQQEMAMYVQQALGEINAANKSGHADLAKHLEADLKFYLKSHEQYEK